MSGAINMIFSTATIPGGGGGIGGLTATVTPSNLYGFRTGKGTAESGGFATCVVSGGTPPYTYSWTRTSGNTEIYAFTPTASSTQFGAFMANFDTEFNAVWKCEVTDSAATTVNSDTVTIQLSNSGDPFV